MELQSMESAPKDGKVIFLRAVWGTEPDHGKVSFEGRAQWRTERRAGFIDPLGRGDVPAYDSTGWMRMDNDKRVPGRAIGWSPA